MENCLFFFFLLVISHYLIFTVFDAKYLRYSIWSSERLKALFTFILTIQHTGNLKPLLSTRWRYSTAFGFSYLSCLITKAGSMNRKNSQWRGEKKWMVTQLGRGMLHTWGFGFIKENRILEWGRTSPEVRGLSSCKNPTAESKKLVPSVLSAFSFFLCSQ